jgi:septal ring factor EnvC (AmiA/AmiB activator)
MAKRLCKFNRHDIAANLGTIHSLVKQPRYLCRACARTSAESSALCKPESIPVLPEAVTSGATTEVVISKAKEKKKSLKKLKKAAKKQKKLEKQLQKLTSRQAKIEQKLVKINHSTGVAVHQAASSAPASLH